MPLRIAIGPCKCVPPYRDAIDTLACEAITARLDTWRERLPGDLTAVPAEHYETIWLDGHRVTLSTSKHSSRHGDTLVVLGALVHTWSRPTYLTLGAVGRFYAEGLVISEDGSVEAAPDSLMWGFR
jgi:hypothetical protein